ncbi:hypothetical protein Q8A73_020737 [Channa argus]|nr:hypothetical protein Q8A73_020737 [Channa argus]
MYLDPVFNVALPPLRRDGLYIPTADTEEKDQIGLKQETIHQNHNTTGMEEKNQNPERRSNKAAKRSKAGSSSGSSDQQVSVDELMGKNGFRTGLKRLWIKVWSVSEKEKMADGGPCLSAAFSSAMLDRAYGWSLPVRLSVLDRG